MRFVESEYSLNKGFTNLIKDKRKSENTNIITHVFTNRNKTSEMNSGFERVSNKSLSFDENNIINNNKTENESN